MGVALCGATCAGSDHKAAKFIIFLGVIYGVVGIVLIIIVCIIDNKIISKFTPS
jgi:hypothetical protein